MASVDHVPMFSALDYVGLHRDKSTQATIQAIRRELLSVTPAKMSAAERKAWGINLYNLLVIEAVLDGFGPGGAPPVSVRDVKGFFDTPRVEVEGKRYSLDAFERHFLFADFDGQGATPPGLDARVHFAIVCAARGCPMLMARPYRAATLDFDLDAACRMTFRSPAHLRKSIATARYEISSIFDWYPKDFGGRPGVIAFLKRLGPTGLRLALEARGDSALAGFIPWDWRLNQLGPELRGEKTSGR